MSDVPCMLVLIRRAWALPTNSTKALVEGLTSWFALNILSSPVQMRSGPYCRDAVPASAPGITTHGLQVSRVPTRQPAAQRGAPTVHELLYWTFM